jgi:hypothetical protein
LLGFHRLSAGKDLIVNYVERTLNPSDRLCKENSLKHQKLVLARTCPMGYRLFVNKKLIARVMGELGRRTSKKKAAASRRNGKLGGRPPMKSKKRKPDAK